MGNTADHMQENFQVAQPEVFEGIYGYDPEKKWSGRNSHDPWTWWHQVDGDSYPHFTTYATDFTGKSQVLVKFHITYFYNKQRAKAVHVHFDIKFGTTAEISGVDFNRTGGDKLAAQQQFKGMRGDYLTLGQSFIDRVFD